MSQKSEMAITPVEIVAIAIVLIVFVMWGPKKIPELARSLGIARKEFQKGTVEGETNPQVQQSADDSMVGIARKLGINTEGKTAEQISQEIIKHSETRT